MSADFAQFTTFHQITFNMFQRNVFGFRYQPQCQQDKQYVQSRIPQKVLALPQRVEHGQERCANDHVGNPVVAVEQVMPKSRPFSG
ncbi:Uncharacterised protein [Escherichia coli]|uniref:Uncharacterized protein n=1 Tax=Escherichia coli TaxID=562 RepID=A0A376VCI2_ECOLX|nr:Uncharacterised protein [Escherichia coli]